MTGPSDTFDPGPVVPVPVTPLRADGTIDWDATEQQLVTLRSLGITWVALGYASEVDKLHPSQVTDLVSVVRAAGLAVMSGVELDPTADRTAQAAIAAGATALLVRPVAGSEPGAVGRALRGLATAFEVGVVYQDAPQHTGVDVPAETLLDWFGRVPRLAAKLEGDTAVAKMARVRQVAGRGPVLLGGRGGRYFVDELRAGADATMPGPAFVDVFAAIANHVRHQDDARARTLADALVPFHSATASSMPDFILHQQHLLRLRFGVSLVPRTTEIDADAARSRYAEAETLLRAAELPMPGLSGIGRS